MQPYYCMRVQSLYKCRWDNSDFTNSKLINMKRSEYLGHKHQEQLSILASRLTLKFQKEISLYFFDKVWIDYKDSWNNEAVPLQGFTFTKGKLTLEEAEEIIKDLECIFVNKINFNEYDCTFAIASDPAIMQAWYNMMHEGSCARAIIRKFYVGGTRIWTNTENEREEFRIQWYVDNPCPQV
jgi:hypothetical protein